MSDILEKSLDEIIGDKRSQRRAQNPKKNRPKPHAARPRAQRPPKSVPEPILKSAGGRQMLRLKNVHPELNGEDLNNLFQNIAPVDFVKFDPRDETIAFVCFQHNTVTNNRKAIDAYDGKKAMGNTLVVENAVSLADRIAPLASRVSSARERPSGKGKGVGKPRAREPKREKAKPRERKPAPTAEELDAELNNYMNVDQPEEKPFAPQDNGQ